MSNDDVLAAQIKSSIITKIKTQEYLPGELLPSERDFATMYSVSRYLIHDIFDELIKTENTLQINLDFLKKMKYTVFIEFVLETRNLLQLSLPMFLFTFFQISIITILSTYRFMII